MRLVLSLSDEDRAALGALARENLRSMRDQALWIIREAAKQHGLLGEADPLSSLAENHHARSDPPGVVNM